MIQLLASFMGRLPSLTLVLIQIMNLLGSGFSKCDTNHEKCTVSGNSALPTRVIDVLPKNEIRELEAVMAHMPDIYPFNGCRLIASFPKH